MRKFSKILMIILALLMMFSALSACDNNTPDPQPNSQMGWVIDPPPQRTPWEDDDYGWVLAEDDGIPVFGDGLNTYSMDYKLFGNTQEQINEAIAEIIDVLDKFNTLMSAGNSAGDVGRFNAAARNEAVEVDFWTYDLVKLSKEWYDKTDGYFNPASFPLVKLWDVRGLFVSWGAPPASLPSLDSIASVQQYCKMELVSAYEDEGKYYLKKSDARVEIELGAVSKGYAADIAKEIVLKHGIRSGFINLSGNVVFINGNGNENSNWVTALDQPHRSYDEYLETGRMYFTTYYAYDESCVVSGDYQLYYIYEYPSKNTVRCAHIINSKTGMPLNVYYDEVAQEYKNKTSGLIMVNIIGSVSALCDILSTATILMPMQEAHDFMLDLQEFKSIMVAGDKTYTTTGLVYLYIPQSSAAAYQGYMDAQFLNFSKEE